MFKNLNCLIGIIDSDNLVIFKFCNSKVDLKDNFANIWRNSKAQKFLNSNALKWYEVRCLKTGFKGQNFGQNLDPLKKFLFFLKFCFLLFSHIF